MENQKSASPEGELGSASSVTISWSPLSLRPTVMGTNGMVSSGHYLATLAGVEVLKRGGNAIDAGVTAGICLNVLQPDMTNFGGVAPIIIYLAENGEVVTISGLGTWPKAANIDSYIEKTKGDLPVGVLRSVVPAAPDAWITALDRWGTMSFAEVTEFAVELANNGFPVYDFLHDQIRKYQWTISQWPSSARVFLPQGRVPQAGEILKQKDLADTLKRMAAAEKESSSKGRHAGLMAARDLFYKGEIAVAITKFCQEEGGLLTLDDLADFHVAVEAPVQTCYRDYDVYCCGPWCQGPVLAQVLNLLEFYDVKAFGHNTAQYVHLLTEALKLVFADREKYYGDPRFIEVPITGLLSKEYAQDRKALIDLNKAWSKMPPPGNPRTWEGISRDNPCEEDNPCEKPEVNPDLLLSDTSYVCAVDRKGNAFSATPSDVFCHTPIVPGLGIIISPRGSQSWLDPKHASSIGPGKRPRLTPNPAIVLKDRRLFMPFGTPGGDVQCQTMLQVFLNIVEFGMTPQQAVEAPRFATWSFPNSFYPHPYHPGLLSLEGRLSRDIVAVLRNKGHKIKEWAYWDAGAGAACVIVLDPETGVLQGGADPRRMAYAIGW